MKIAIAFIGTLIFYALIGPIIGLFATILLGDGIQYSQMAWAYIELNWLQSLHCGPFDGGDCLYLNPRTLVTAKFFSALSVQGFSRLLPWVYLIGLLPALFAGLLVAFGRLIGGRDFRVWHAFALGVLVAAIILGPVSENRYHGASFAESAAWFVFVCAFASTVCALPVRHWWPHSSSDANASPSGDA
jgi:hypothetical protein